MPRLGSTEQLGRAISQLRSQRQQHARAIAEIDAAVARFGIKLDGTAKRGRPAGVSGATKRRRKRGRFKETAEQFILGYIKANPDATTAQINQAWQGARRGGKPDNTLTKLTKSKQLTRTKVKGGRGSTYRTA